MALLGRTSERFRRIREAGDAAAQTGAPGAVPPAARELRAQGVHRLQVGLFGLAAMLLLVSLASVIMERVKTADRSAVAQAPAAGTMPSPSASASPASDPLVDLGVAPEVPVAGATHKPGKPDAQPAH